MPATLCNELTTDKVAMYTAQQKKNNQFSFVCIFLMRDRNRWIFFHKR